MAKGLLLVFLLVSHLFVSHGARNIAYRALNSTRPVDFSSPIRNITIENKCGYTVWPGIESISSSNLSTTGFALKKGEARVLEAPSSWEGRFWGRSLCSNKPTGDFSCATGDCGSQKIECSGAGAKFPATLAVFSFDNSNGQDLYGVSVINGYNLPLMVVVSQRPQSGQIC
ncbi:PR5-like receptor kinase [Cardamine amara subsp. amara]|uniref:PR5-like receptor kinase n=1 Tax=Cardamine amara subsp. amara TaxID=228776 RepID=A0ABD1BYL1_CARAN